MMGKKNPTMRIDFLITNSLLGAPFGFVEQGKDVGGLIQGFHDGLVSTEI